MSNIILHACCATCVAGVIKQLKDKYKITCYFYNPNIQPKEEYERRLADVKKYCEKKHVKLIVGWYSAEKWFNFVKGFEIEPEGGSLTRHSFSEGGSLTRHSFSEGGSLTRHSFSEGGSLTRHSFSEGGQRCVKCYTMRLERTVKAAKSRGFDIFASTLTISPHKKAEIINPIGQKLAEKYGVKFLEADFKKHDGFKCACEIARHEKFYKQDYCGCIYSRNT